MLVTINFCVIESVEILKVIFVITKRDPQVHFITKKKVAIAAKGKKVAALFRVEKGCDQGMRRTLQYLEKQFIDVEDPSKTRM